MSLQANDSGTTPPKEEESIDPFDLDDLLDTGEAREDRYIIHIC